MPDAAQQAADVLDRRRAAAVERSLAARREAETSNVLRLIEACLEIVRDTQQLDPPVAAIVKRAGVPLKTLYRLFPSKSDLLLAVWDHAVGVTVAAIDQRLAGAGAPEVRLHVWVDGLAEAITDPASAPFTLSAPAYAARLPDVLPFPHPALLGPLEQTLADLAPRADLVGEPAQTARVVFDLVSSGMTRLVAAGARPTPADLQLLHRAVERVTGVPTPGAGPGETAGAAGVDAADAGRTGADGARAGAAGGRGSGRLRRGR